MRITLRQITEESLKINRITNWLDINLRRMSNWSPDFAARVLGSRKKNWTRHEDREYERANRVIRETRRLINAALHVLCPTANREKILALTGEIVTYQNIIGRFENVSIECKTN